MLPAHAQSIITEVLNSEITPLKGTTGLAHNGNIEIWYEYLPAHTIKKGTILLIMGLANDSLTWPDAFIDILCAEGYDVVRYDNRDVGQSTWIHDWQSRTTYTLNDMAQDGIAVMDHLGLQSAHIVGVSMGGMIGQTMAILYPNRIASLSSIMSTGDSQDKSMPSPNKWIIAQYFYSLLRYGIFKNEENTVKRMLIAWHLLRGDQQYEIDIKERTEVVLRNMRLRNGYNSKAGKQQLAAIYKSGSRYDQLKQLDVPTLVIHGLNDPLIPVEHGYKCAQIIPEAQSLWVDNMGHTLPGIHYTKIADALFLRMESI